MFLVLFQTSECSVGSICTRSTSRVQGDCRVALADRTNHWYICLAVRHELYCEIVTVECEHACLYSQIELVSGNCGNYNDSW